MKIAQNKTPRARIAWIAPEDGPLLDAQLTFERAGYSVGSAHDQGPADIAVVDFRGRHVSAKAAQRLAAATRSAAPECGIVYLGGPGLTAAERAHLRRSGDLVIIEDDLGPAVDVCRTRLRIRAVAEETGERLKSVAASTRLAEFPPIDTSSAPPSVLIAGAPGAAALAAIAAAETVAGNCAAVMSAGQAMRALETGSFDAAVFIPKSDGDPLIGLTRSMRRHRRFQDLPVLMTAPIESGRRKLATANGAEPIMPEHIGEDLPARLLSLSRRARLMTAMRGFLTACAGDGVRDRYSGAFTAQFFGQHAERVFARADHSGRPVCLIGLRLAAAKPDEPSAAAIRTLTEAARLVNRVTRAEDFVGRIASDTFVILMSSAIGDDAQEAARRIEGVIANTMFRSRSERRLFAVAAATAAIERGPAGRLDESIAAVLASLNQKTPRTVER